MPLENLIRITILLPSPDRKELHILIDSIITQLAQRYGGATSSAVMPEPMFTGTWFDKGIPDYDEIIYIFCDAGPKVGQPFEEFYQTLLAFLEKLREECCRNFQQEEIWLTVSSIQRVVGE